MDARHARWWKYIVVLGLFVLGCGRAAAPTHASAPTRPQHRLQFNADPQVPECGKRDDLYDQLSRTAQTTIGAEGNHALRVDIERRSKKIIRLAIELVNEDGSIVNKIDQAVGGHMDCPRLVRIAAGLANTMVDDTVLAKKTAEPRPAPSVPFKSRVKLEQKPEPAEIDVERLRRPTLTRRSIKDEGYAPVPHASTVAPEAPAPAPPPPVQIPIDVKVRVSQEPPPENLSLSNGKYFVLGVGVLRGQDPNWNAGARLGIGYGVGSFALEADLFAVGAVVDTVTFDVLNRQTYAVMLNLGLCYRSTSLGLCLTGSAMQDGFSRPVAVPSPTDTASTIVQTIEQSKQPRDFGAGLGAGMRAWYEILSGSAWALRLNFEMTIPVQTFGGEEEDLRVWKNVTPTGAAVLTFARAF